MHSKFSKADTLASTVIGGAIEVHRDKGPGLVESIYERCLLHELELRELKVKQQIPVTVSYKGLSFETPLRLDLLVEECLIIEIKAVQEVLPVHKAQLLSYMKLLNVPVGILINFHSVMLRDGISRLLLPNANR